MREELKVLSELLDIQWFPSAVYNAKRDRYEGRYALTAQWPSNDPRWELHRKGEIGEPFDILGWFCKDKQVADSIPLERSAIRKRAIEMVAAADCEKVPWRKRLRSVMQHNADRREEIKDEVSDLVHEEARERYYQGRRFGVNADLVSEESSAATTSTEEPHDAE